MSMILRPVWFEFCPKCREHGHIVFVDGTTSAEIYSIEMGDLEARLARRTGKITELEEKVIKGQVRSGDLPLEATFEDLVETIDHLAEVHEQSLEKMKMPKQKHLM